MFSFTPTIVLPSATVTSETAVAPFNVNVAYPSKLIASAFILISLSPLAFIEVITPADDTTQPATSGSYVYYHC